MTAHKGPASSRPRCTRSGSSIAVIPVYITSKLQGYIEQTLYIWWSLNRSGQPVQYWMWSKISLSSYPTVYFPEFVNTTSAADRLVTVVLLNTDLLIQTRNSHAKVSLFSPTQTNDSHHFYSYQVVPNRRSQVDKDNGAHLLWTQDFHSQTQVGNTWLNTSPHSTWPPSALCLPLLARCGMWNFLRDTGVVHRMTGYGGSSSNGRIRG
jgi:hypothetical protein